MGVCYINDSSQIELFQDLISPQGRTTLSPSCFLSSASFPLFSEHDYMQHQKHVGNKEQVLTAQVR